MLRNAVQRPENNANPSGGYQKKIFIAQKVCDFVGMVEISWYSKYYFGAMLIAFGDAQLVATFLGKNYLVCRMHIGPKCIQILWNHQKKIPLLENYKEWALCAILRENNPFFLAGTEAKTCCAMLRRGLKIMQILLGNQKTIFIAQEVCDFVGKVEISTYSKNLFRAMVIGFGDTQLVDTFLGKNQL